MMYYGNITNDVCVMLMNVDGKHSSSQKFVSKYINVNKKTNKQEKQRRKYIHIYTLGQIFHAKTIKPIIIQK